jgi:hypothetical protein
MRTGLALRDGKSILPAYALLHISRSGLCDEAKVPVPAYHDVDLYQRELPSKIFVVDWHAGVIVMEKLRMWSGGGVRLVPHF